MRADVLYLERNECLVCIKKIFNWKRQTDFKNASSSTIVNLVLCIKFLLTEIFRN